MSNLLAPPLAALLELSHRCPLRCPYCSNPVQLEKKSAELDSETWKRVIREAADMGMMQIHFSGGEPTVRPDLEELVKQADEVGLYTNLITSAVMLDRARVERLADAGLQHVQISFQDTLPDKADWVGGYKGGHQKKLEVAAMVTDAGLPLTVNAILTRHNLERAGDLIDMAVDLGARRLELANVQYYGWGLKNRAALIPTRQQLDASILVVEEARERLKGILVIDFVLPDYYASQPKSCMGGWAQKFLTITPAGKVLPCHAAESLPGLAFDSVQEKSLSEIWVHSTAFEAYRGTDWMPEPCRSCDQREVDWGGCRCQAMALTGDATNTDPACHLSPFHDNILALAERESAQAAPEFVYRTLSVSKRS